MRLTEGSLDLEGGASVTAAGKASSAAGGLTLAELLRQSAASARMCTSEGRDGLAPSGILRCTECGSTVSNACKGHPEHANLTPLTDERIAPAEFEATLKRLLPMCFELTGLADLADQRPSGRLIGEASSGDFARPSAEALAAAAASSAKAAEAKGKQQAKEAGAAASSSTGTSTSSSSSASAAKVGKGKAEEPPAKRPSPPPSR